MYFSVVTFTTLGYGDLTPSSGVSRALAAIEAFAGSFTIALFVVVFVKKMTR
ncbi:MAG: voltage-gated potassium channel Kch [Pseudohongiellaceae bacterium]|jgi:voltage-gated potassium channel Kch